MSNVFPIKIRFFTAWIKNWAYCALVFSQHLVTGDDLNVSSVLVLCDSNTSEFKPMKPSGDWSNLNDES